jgi:hypothetical protein
MKLGRGALLYSGVRTGFVKYDKYMNKYKPSELKDQAPHMSKTKLKRMLYSLINRRDKLEKKNLEPTAEIVDKTILWGMTQAKDTLDITNIKEAILIVTDEIAHREFAKMCPDADTKQNGDKKE